MGKQIKQAHKNIRQEDFEKKREERAEKFTTKLTKTFQKSSSQSQQIHKFRELNEDEMNTEGKSSKRKSKKSLAERLEEDNRFTERNDGHQMVFKPKKSRSTHARRARKRTPERKTRTEAIGLRAEKRQNQTKILERETYNLRKRIKIILFLNGK